MTYYFKHPWTPSEILFSGSLRDCIDFGRDFITKVEEEENEKFDILSIDYIIDEETYNLIHG